MKARWIAVGEFFALTGCAHDPSPGDRASPMDVGNRMLRVGCPGTPTVIERKVANRHKPRVIDTIKTISCDGVEMGIYVGVLASDPNGLPIYLEVRKPNSGLPRYMSIGEPVRGLFDVLGKPSEQHARAMKYITSESGSSVTFGVHGDRIASVRWDWYID